MGAWTSRQNGGVEEVDFGVNHAYRYPPKSGNYFSNHFIMGGERFDTAQPEMYLFGENTDLNFLGSRPAPFPYPAPSASEPSRTLKALVNIRKESLRFVRVPDDSLSLKEPENRSSTQFNIEFTFDCDIRCAITIMYFCTEEVTNSGLVYTPKDASMNSETYHYKRGANQQFSQVCHVFDPSQYPEDNLLYIIDQEVIPILIYCIAEEGEEPNQAHATIAIVEKHADGYVMKPLKQKLFVDGLCYLLQEIYGIENKTAENAKVINDEDPDDNGAECVICMCDLRDTLILPCRHLCLCNCCADSLRYQANNCPICRAPFRALLQIKALQKSASLTGGISAPANITSGENVPQGYEAVSLIEALNGPSVIPQQATIPPTGGQNMYVPIPQNPIDDPLDVSLDNARSKLDGSSIDQSKSKTKGASSLEDSTTQTERSKNNANDVTPTSTSGEVQMRLSLLLAQDSIETSTIPGEIPSPSHSSASKKKKKSKRLNEDSVVCIDETKNGDPYDKKSKKSAASSPLTNDDADIAETNFGINDDADDIEALTETLSLLDVLKECDKIVGLTDENKVSNRKSTDSSKEEISREDDDQTYFVEGNDFYFLQPALALINQGSGKKKQKSSSARSSGKGRGNCSDAQEDLNVSQEIQSLPGTPLSTSSAVSRTSDASMSSASSTRALIVAQPPPKYESADV